ncbi:MAG: hypothetical protein B7C54_06205 [Acidimicrobiales bacterium mtb01]|nr:hypothetical protein [Actinomycetota bacterium]TEX46781.1 MAG: hypothetical protein B7C54_06205 [Acidimicrobiales bacterium mtb01]
MSTSLRSLRGGDMGNIITAVSSNPRVASLGRAVAEPIRRRGVRVPEVAIGLAVIASSIAAFVALGGDSDSGRRVLVSSRDLPAGVVVSESDMSLVAVSSSEALAVLPETLAAEVIGMRTTIDVRAGTPLSASLLSDVTPLDASEGLVGIVVGLNQAPVDLVPGDVVSVVVIDQSVEGISTTTALPFDVSVWGVSAPDDLMKERSVTLRVPLSSIESFIGHDEMHLVKVGG